MRKEAVITGQEVERRLGTLPSDVAEAFESVNTGRQIFGIGKSYGLNVDTIGEVAREVGYVMLGLVPTAEFISDLAKIVGDRGKAATIAQEINQRIFLPIRESLRRMPGSAWSGDLAAEAGRPAPPPLRVPPPPPFAKAPAYAEPARPAGGALAGKPPPSRPPEARPHAPPVAPKPPPFGVAQDKPPAPIIIEPLPTGGDGGQRLKKEEITSTEIERLERTMMPEPPAAPAPPPTSFPPTPLGSAAPEAPPPAALPSEDYARTREAFSREFESFQEHQGGGEQQPANNAQLPSGPSPYVITKEDMQRPNGAPTQTPAPPQQPRADPYHEPIEEDPS
ncbi:MAG: hypothetical protein A3B37_01355 [Candidatus Sungbacteria bacterium RIFCSPLOWO2_01_FULL_59_16]|uniref:Uncharacterized protein n=1 Tax=Candidatus Sungbacteria bacterium RIFCSPLOWO2_01_FULL_59_16 TaxID=1802280 RepID=A0A1G2LEB7_9BACT|nr:MAG: hypothetical protein A3B37_01355 [Candidatus Sungbacteria bacterium RIFCSPLOWO2_01_FULL_59_16]